MLYLVAGSVILKIHNLMVDDHSSREKNQVQNPHLHGCFIRQMLLQLKLIPASFLAGHGLLSLRLDAQDLPNGRSLLLSQSLRILSSCTSACQVQQQVHLFSASLEPVGHVPG